MRSRFLSDERFAMGLSALLHVSIFASFFLLIGWKERDPKVVRTRQELQVSIVPGDGLTPSIPKLASPSAVKPVPNPPEDVSPTPDPAVKPAVESQSDPVDLPPGPKSPADGSDALPSSDGGTIWTPPAPTPNPSLLRKMPDVQKDVRVVMPDVSLPKGASDPVLVSYDQARYAAVSSMGEAAGLMNAGTITMSVLVDEKGAVSLCSVALTSGSPILDAKACALVSSYQYRPAQDAFGKPHGAIVSEVMEWAKDGKFTSPGDDPAAPPSLSPSRDAIVRAKN